MQTTTFKAGIDNKTVREYPIFPEHNITESMNYKAHDLDLRLENYDFMKEMPENSNELSPNLYACASILGQSDRHLRSYTHTSPKMSVYEIDGAYIDSHQEVILDNNFALFSEYTPYRVHPLVDGGGGRIRAFKTKVKQKLYSFKKNKAKHLSGRTLYISRAGLEDNPGHFLCDYLGPYHLYLLAKEKYNLAEFDRIILNTSKSFQRGMYEVLGIPSDKIIPALPQRMFHCETLVTATLSVDWEFIDFDYYLHYAGLGFNPHIYDLYAPYMSVDPALKRSMRPKIYIEHGKNARRAIVNEDEVMEVYKEYGYEVVFPEAMTQREQLEIFSNAIAVSGLSGAGNADLYFTQSDCLLFEIFTARFMDKYFFSSQTARCAPYCYMIGELVDDSCHPMHEDVRVDLTKLRTALDRVEAFLTRKIREEG